MATRFAFVDDSGETRLAGFLVPEPGGSLPDPITTPVTIAPTDGADIPLTIQSPGVTADFDQLLSAKATDGTEILYADTGGDFSLKLQEDGANFTIYNTTGDQMIQFKSGPQVSFFGVSPVSQPAAPVTLGDVIAALQALGLVGT